MLTTSNHHSGSAMRKQLSIVFLTLFLISALMAFSIQSDFVNIFQEKLLSYYEHRQPQKLHMFFNQPVYASGDTAWCKISVFAASGFEAQPGRQIADVALVDETGSLVQRKKVLITEGRATNQLVIPSDATPGAYSVVASMRSVQGQSTIFQCRLWISGPVRRIERGEDRIAFFAEGGNFIAGITNKVVVTGPAGASGIVVDRGQQRISSFTLDRDGLAFFIINPAGGQEYSARIIGHGEVSLPLPTDDGIGLLTTVPSNGQAIRLTVQVPQASQYRRQRLHLVMTGQESVLYAAELSFEESNFMTFSFPQDELPEGVARISIFDSEGAPLAERLLMIHRSSAEGLTIEMEQETVSTRGELPIVIRLSDDGKAISGALSITVYSSDFVSSHYSMARNIVDEALMYGDIAHAGRVGPRVNDPSVDNFLITQKWSHFSWPDVFNQRVVSQGAERLLRLNGKLSRTDGRPFPDSTLLTFFLQRSVMTYEALVDETGRFDIPVLIDFYGDEEVFYQAESRGQIIEDVQIDISKESHIQFDRPAVTATREVDTYYSFAGKRTEIQKSYTYHMRKDVYETQRSLNALIEEEVFGADVKIELDDYLLFPTMSETLREIVPLLQHRKRKGNDVIRLYFEDADRFSQGDPLLIVDGVITRNITYFLSLKPVDVASIAVIHSFDKLRAFGSLGKNGIVLIETRIPDNAERVPRSEHTFMATGLERDLLKLPEKGMSTRGENTPDLRTNLYWNPNVTIDSSGQTRLNIQTSDVTGTFKIRIEGFTASRTPVYAEKEFRVVFE